MKIINRNSKIHMQLGNGDSPTCHIPTRNTQIIHKITQDPRKVTCKNCQKTKYFKRVMLKIEQHLTAEINGCKNPNCKVCYP